MNFANQKMVKKLRKEFPVGCRIVLDEMDDRQAPPIGTQGTCNGVDDAGNILVSWDTGVAKIAGGAKMFEVSGLSDVGNIGARNAEAAKKILKEKGIRLVAEDTGLNYGRTVELHCDTGEFLIKSVGKPIKTI